jgi:isoleucyl-tRNA synthetase
MYRILSALARLAAPIISFTAEEIWQFMPHTSADDKESVFLNQMPEKSGIEFSTEFIEKWELIYNTRLGANKALEEARNAKTIGKSLEAKMIIKCSGELYSKYTALAGELKDILIVSGVEVAEGEGETVYEVAKADGDKCERCWCYSCYVGTNSAHPTLCERCAIAVEA